MTGVVVSLTAIYVRDRAAGKRLRVATAAVFAGDAPATLREDRAAAALRVLAEAAGVDLAAAEKHRLWRWSAEHAACRRKSHGGGAAKKSSSTQTQAAGLRIPGLSRSRDAVVIAAAAMSRAGDPRPKTVQRRVAQHLWKNATAQNRIDSEVAPSMTRTVEEIYVAFAKAKNDGEREDLVKEATKAMFESAPEDEAVPNPNELDEPTLRGLVDLEEARDDAAAKREDHIRKRLEAVRAERRGIRGRREALQSALRAHKENESIQKKKGPKRTHGIDSGRRREKTNVPRKEAHDPAEDFPKASADPETGSKESETGGEYEMDAGGDDSIGERSEDGVDDDDPDTADASLDEDSKVASIRAVLECNDAEARSLLKNSKGDISRAIGFAMDEAESASDRAASLRSRG